MGDIINFDRGKLEKNLAASKIRDQFKELEPRLMKLPQFRGRVPSKTFLSKDPNIKRGHCYWIESENSLFTVVSKDKKGVQLRPLDMNATVSAGYTIYEMNQSMVAKEPLLELTDENGEHSDYFSDINDDIKTFLETTRNNVYLLYGRDLHYFTLFDTTIDCDYEEPLTIILDCLTHTWDIVSVDVDMSEEDGMPKVEIWVRDKQKTPTENALANHMLYLMPFDNNVVPL